MSSDLVLMKKSYFTKREAKRDRVQSDISFMDTILKEKSDDLDAQYRRVFSVNGKTAQINIVGPLSPEGPDAIDVYFGYGGTAYKNIERASAEALELYEKGDIENILVRINTPGGTVDGVDSAYNALKKIGHIGVVKNDGMIASAGVWLASAFEKVEASVDSAIFGSIGVAATYVDDKQYYDNFGVQVIDITNKQSPNKRPDISTDEGYKVIQKELDDLYDVFVSKVTASRPVTKKQIDALKGEVLIASKAIELGFMDAPLIVDSQDTAEKTKPEVGKAVKTEKEVPIVELEQKDIDLLVSNAVTAERSRISAIVKLAEIDLSDSLITAISEDTKAEDFAIAQVDARKQAKVDAEAKETAEIQAAKDSRIKAGLENIDTELSSDTHSQEPEAENKKDASISAVCGDLIGKLKKGVK